jgi:hypothetical protein
VPISDYTPSLDNVGALVRDRTFDSNGNEMGTFTPDTRPTNTQADQIITDAVSTAYPMFGEDIPDAPDPDNPDALRNAAKNSVAYLAAALVEISHFGEQVARGNSPYQQYMDLWESSSKVISKSIDGLGETPPGGGGGSLDVFGDFPADAGGMVGWGTIW